MSVKINSLEIENVKRVKAVKLQPSPNGLTVIGGRNGQGKTSVLDAIAWALGGGRKKPSQVEREGSVNQPYLKVVLNNGLIVERKGKNSTLSVTDPTGEKGGQNLLDSFVEELAIDLPKFMEKTSKEKADTLLQIIGVGDQLALLEKEEKQKESERLLTGQDARRKKSHAVELIHYDGVPDDFIKASDLIQQQQEILGRNGENQRLRQQTASLQQQHNNQAYLIQQKKQEIERVQAELNELEQQHSKTTNDLATAQKTAEQLQDESTSEIEESIAEIETINDKIRSNHTKLIAEEEAHKLAQQYQLLDDEIEQIRRRKRDLLKSADLPLPELSVDEGELVYRGQKWDNMSGSEQLRVSTAIVRKLKPQCGFVLIDKLEQMDLQTLNEFSQWLEQENLQAIAARVTTTDEAAIIIEDGEVVGTPEVELKQTENVWKGGF